MTPAERALLLCLAREMKNALWRHGDFPSTERIDELVRCVEREPTNFISKGLKE